MNLEPDFLLQLLNGEHSAIAAAFAAEPSIDSPRCGLVRGHEPIMAFLAAEAAMLTRLGATAGRVKRIKTTTGAVRVVHEWRLDLGPPFARPVKYAAVMDVVDESIGAIRLYYNYGGFSADAAFVRKAMRRSNPALWSEIPAPVRAYLHGIARSDFAVWKLFAPGAVFDPPPNMPFVGATLIKFFAVALAEPGGIPLRPVSVTTDATTCAIEENLASWGTIQFEHDTAGLAVYEFNGDNQLTAARIYDDIPLNPFTVPGWLQRNWATVAANLVAAGQQIRYVPSADDDPLTAIARLFFT